MMQLFGHKFQVLPRCPSTESLNNYGGVRYYELLYICFREVCHYFGTLMGLKRPQPKHVESILVEAPETRKLSARVAEAGFFQTLHQGFQCTVP